MIRYGITVILSFWALLLNAQTVIPVECRAHASEYGHYGYWDDLPKGCHTVLTRDITDKVPDRYEKALKRAKDYLKDRSGESLYSQLTLKKAYALDSSCYGARIVMRYEWKVNNKYPYLFSLVFDEKGRLVGDHKTPEYDGKGSDPTSIVPICDVITEASQMKDVFKPIDHVEFGYNSDENCFVWKVWDRALYPSRQPKYEYAPDFPKARTHRVIHFHGNTGKLIKTATEEKKDPTNVIFDL